LGKAVPTFTSNVGVTNNPYIPKTLSGALFGNTGKNAVIGESIQSIGNSLSTGAPLLLSQYKSSGGSGGGSLAKTPAQGPLAPVKNANSTPNLDTRREWAAAIADTANANQSTNASTNTKQPVQTTPAVKVISPTITQYTGPTKNSFLQGYDFNTGIYSLSGNGITLAIRITSPAKRK
jgi:hypothetical protein